MLRTIMFFSYLVLHTIYTGYHLIIVYILGALGMKEEQEARISSTARNWARALIRVSGSKVEVVGAELVPAEGAVLFVSNHQSNFDIALMLGFVPRPKGFIAKIELKKIPIVSTWMTKMHSLFLDRQNMRKSVLTMRAAIELLKAGHCLVLFPEGTRSKGGSMAQFKRGGLNIAEKAKVPVVPVTIVDSFKIMEGNQGLKITPAQVKVFISEPIYPSTLPPGEDLSDNVYGIIHSHLSKK